MSRKSIDNLKLFLKTYVVFAILILMASVFVFAIKSLSNEADFFSEMKFWLPADLVIAFFAALISTLTNHPKSVKKENIKNDL